MREMGRGRIINISSIAGLIGTPAGIMDAVGYSASKAALIGLTRDLAVKWAKDGITVNAIAPGFFRTRMTDALLANHEAAITAITPMGRIGGEGELKGIAVALASDAGALRHRPGHRGRRRAQRDVDAGVSPRRTTTSLSVMSAPLASMSAMARRPSPSTRSTARDRVTEHGHREARPPRTEHRVLHAVVGGESARRPRG